MTKILMLMPESHLQATFNSHLLTRLRSLGELAIAPTATNHLDHRVRDLIAEAQIIVTGTGTAKLDRNVLAGAPNLHAIIHAAGSLRPIVDLDAYDQGLKFSSQAALNAVPVAEYTLAMILLELKGVHGIEKIYRRARQSIDVDNLLAHQGVYNRQVGVISASSIGRRVIEYLQLFELDVVLYDPFVTAEEATQLGTRLVELETLLSTSDLVTLHSPLLPETVGMIGASELALLRDQAILINTARGALIDQNALIKELQTGRIRAVIDVTDPEIPPKDSPLWDLDNLILTPHVAGSRGLELCRIGQGVVDEIERYVQGKVFLHEIGREQYVRFA